MKYICRNEREYLWTKHHAFYMKDSRKKSFRNRFPVCELLSQLPRDCNKFDRKCKLQQGNNCLSVQMLIGFDYTPT